MSSKTHLRFLSISFDKVIFAGALRAGNDNSNLSLAEVILYDFFKILSQSSALPNDT